MFYEYILCRKDWTGAPYIGVPRDFNQGLIKAGSYYKDEINGTCLARVLSNSNNFLYVVQLIMSSE